MAVNKMDKSDALSFSAPNSVDQDKRNFLITATACTGAIGAAVAAVPFVGSMLPSERAKAAGAPVEPPQLAATCA